MIDTSKYPIYNGEELKENEYLLKVSKDGTGFLTKLTQKVLPPKTFTDWKNSPYNPSLAEKLPTYVFTEIFKSGWKIKEWRYGMSQNWAKLIHPDGFTIEIYLTEFLNLVLKESIIKGELVGSYKWEPYKLVKSI